MIYIQLFLEFLMIGTFSVGGGLATLPFLYSLSSRTNWFDQATLIDMIAISESTPGPIGINMATYAGFKTAGILGGVLASVAVMIFGLGLMLVIAKALSQFKDHPLLRKIFYGLRPTIAALIGFAAINMLLVTVINLDSGFFVNFKALALLLVILAIGKWGKWHPVAMIGFAAMLGFFIDFG